MEFPAGDFTEIPVPVLHLVEVARQDFLARIAAVPVQVQPTRAEGLATIALYAFNLAQGQRTEPALCVNHVDCSILYSRRFTLRFNRIWRIRDPG